MSRILIVYEQIDTTSNANLSILKDIFSKESLRFGLTKKIKKTDLEWCDICLAIRPNSIYTIEIGRSVVQSGRSFVTLYDDDLINLPKVNSNCWKANYAKQCLQLSQYVISANMSLITLYKSINHKAKFIISNTHVLEEDILPVEMIKGKVKIVYPAGEDHSTLFETFIGPSIDKLYDRHNGQIEVYLIGVSPNIDNIRHKECIYMVNTMPLEVYNRFMRENRFDIGIAPLFDTPFSNKKYFNKYLEYAKCGIVGLYSNCLPYTYVVKHKINGLLVSNTKKDWYEALDYAIKAIVELKTMASQAQDHIRKEFSFDHILKIYYNEMNCLTENEKEYGKVIYHKNIFNSLIFEQRCLSHRLVSHIINDGFIQTLKSLINKIV